MERQDVERKLDGVTKRANPVWLRRKSCVFCGSGNLSKEHIWPDGARKLFQGSEAPAHTEVQATLIGKGRTALGQPKEMTRQGSTFTKKVRVVCATCNNTWMSALEEEAKTILLPLITSQEIILNVDQQRLLAEWLVMKTMFAEHNVPDDAIIPFADRQVFKIN